MNHPRPLRRPLVAQPLTAVLALLAAGWLAAAPAEAQRPFATLDPFYQEESARRGFFDGFAAQAEVAYRGTEPMAATGAPPVALSVRLDYALARQMDLAAVFDVSGGLAGALSGTPVRLSWVVLKPYWRRGHTDYAVRLAVDPASEGGFGFRQTDIAFVSTADVGPQLSTDFAVGLRRARVGFERIEVGLDDVFEDGGLALPALSRSRAVGSELRAMWGPRFWLDPGGSHTFVTLTGELMDYDLIASRPPTVAARGTAASAVDTPEEGRYRSGALRLRAGATYSRASFIVSPYASLPLFRWVEVDDQTKAWGPSPDHTRLGFRLTLR
jgi:hypothetical protein